jgi:hypothetical protein
VANVVQELKIGSLVAVAEWCGDGRLNEHQQSEYGECTEGAYKGTF